MRTGCALAFALWASATSCAGERVELRNWFDDPFFQVTRADPSCPLPAGPFVDEAGRQQQSHRRAEKGTTCWLAGLCSRPKAYLYDQDIAEGVRLAFARSDRFDDTTLWVTVQGRVVYIEGCVGSEAAVPALEDMVRAVPFVEQAIAIVRPRVDAPVPYRLRGGPR